jgi:hypothetical protein
VADISRFGGWRAYLGHRLLVDLSPFGLPNDNEVFHADDRPYGLIEAAVQRDGAPPAGPGWAGTPARCSEQAHPPASLRHCWLATV